MGKSGKSRKNDVCIECPAHCCRDLAMEIHRPRTRSEIDSLKWSLMFDTVSVFVRNRQWHMLVKGKCIYLDDDNMCKIYEKRPDTCREHNPPDCERYGKFWDVMIKTPPQLERYLNRSRNGKKAGARRKKR